MSAGAADPRCAWLPAERAVRVELGGRAVAASDRVMLLREHGRLPVFYLPREDVASGALRPSAHATRSPRGRASWFDVHGGDVVVPAGAWSYDEAPPAGAPDTRGLVSFDWHRMDAWREEGEPAYVHARDPFTRVEALRSSRSLEVRVGGRRVAASRRPVVVVETGLVARWYVPLVDVDTELLRASPTSSMCPYKGRATYVHVSRDGTLWPDVAWSYPTPLVGLEPVAGLLCFLAGAPGVEVLLDGAPLPGGHRVLHPVAPLPGAAEPTGARAELPPAEHADPVALQAGGRPDQRPAPAPPFPPPGGDARVAEGGATAAPAGPVRRWSGPDGSALDADPRRVRALVAGRVVADSRAALLLSAAGGPATWVLPSGDVGLDAPTARPPVPGFAVPEGHVALDPARVALWLEEDEPRSAPHSAYRRVEALRSGRRVAVRDGARLVADTTRSVALHETGRPVRWCVPPSDVDLAALTPEPPVVVSELLGIAQRWAVGSHPGAASSLATPPPTCRHAAGLLWFDPAVLAVAVGPLYAPAAIAAS